MRVGIIGAGIVGAATAYELSAVAGLEISLFEAGEPGQGATGAALGVWMGAISQKTSGRGWRLRRASLERLATLAPELECLTGKTLAVNRQGIVLLQFDPQEEGHWRRLQQRRQAQGYVLEYWSRETLLSHCPQIQDPRVVGAVYSPQDRQVHPLPFTQALLSGAEARGVQLYLKTPVLSLSAPGAPLAFQTEQGNFPFDTAILCAGLGANQLLNSTVDPLRLQPVLGQALEIQLERILGLPDFQPVLTGQDLHLVPLGDRRYWLGATLEPENEQPDPARLTALWEQACTFYPALAQAQILGTWQGFRPRPAGESAPVIRPLAGYPQVLLATGHYRNGIFLALATALEVRTWLAHIRRVA
ncbi:MAG: NAD(P)/FAD-dependent oxidoreductase [Cyanobacteriota bacterium]